MPTELAYTTCPFCHFRVRTEFYYCKRYFEATCPQCNRKWKVDKKTFILREVK